MASNYKLNPFTGRLDFSRQPGAGGSAGGSDTQVQFNDDTALGGDADFTWDNDTNTLTIGGDIVVSGTVDGVDVLDMRSDVDTNTSGIAVNASNIADHETRITTLETYRRAITTKTNDYTATEEQDYTIVADGSSNTVTITLPASPTSGQIFNIACLDSSFTVDIDFNGKNFYDSSANEVLFKGENLICQYDGTQWVGC